MNMRRLLSIFLITGILISAVSAWAFFGPYGKLWLSVKGEKISIEMLEQNWRDYHVYFAGPWIGRPSAVMFDPKNDGKELIPHKWWVPIESQEDFEYVLYGIRVWQVSFDPKVWSIMGPEKDIYGYMYTAWNHVLIKVVDNNTMWVDDIPLPRLEPADDARTSD